MEKSLDDQLAELGVSQQVEWEEKDDFMIGLIFQ